MREGIGGTFMLGVMMVFIVLFVSFLAIALNYAKAFRVKNQIIDYIEEYEGYTAQVHEKLEGTPTTNGYLDKMSYRVDLNKANIANGTYKDDYNLMKDPGDKYCSRDYGYCVTFQQQSPDGKTKYYKVEAYILFDLPSFFGIGAFPIPVSGETRIVVS